VLEVLARKYWYRLVAAVPAIDKFRQSPFAIFIKRTTQLALKRPVAVLRVETQDVIDYILMFILSFLMMRVLLPR
jgi:hypothetical protein